MHGRICPKKKCVEHCMEKSGKGLIFCHCRAHDLAYGIDFTSKFGGSVHLMVGYRDIRMQLQAMKKKN